MSDIEISNQLSYINQTLTEILEVLKILVPKEEIFRLSPEWDKHQKMLEDLEKLQERDQRNYEQSLWDEGWGGGN